MTEPHEESLNEFEYSPEEQEELKKLDQLNEDADELADLDTTEESETTQAPEVKVDEDLLDDLMTPDPLAEPDQEQESEQKPDEEQEEQERQPDDEPEPAQIPDEIPDFQAELDEIEQRRIEAQGNVDDTMEQLRLLAEQYDDGEIAQGKYDYERLQLERQLKKYERSLGAVELEYQDLSAEATEKTTAYEEARKTSWRNELIKFYNHESNAILRENRHIADQFDQLLESMGNSGVFEGLTNQQILESVRNQLSFRVPELKDNPYNPAQEQKAKQEKPPKPKHDAKIPASLSQMQTTQIPQDDPFAYIRKLSGVEYEQAISKMSDEQQEKFFYGG